MSEYVPRKTSPNRSSRLYCYSAVRYCTPEESLQFVLVIVTCRFHPSKASGNKPRSSLVAGSKGRISQEVSIIRLVSLMCPYKSLALSTISPSHASPLTTALGLKTTINAPSIAQLRS